VKRTFHISFIPWRFYLLLSIILLVVFGLIARLVDLTILNRGFLQHQGDVRVLRVVNTPAFRGMITDRNNYPLAVSTSVYSIWG
jgi:cell division protein FtsI (penicillin-binding protein 3)